MKFFDPGAEGVFLRRPNRFTIVAGVEGRETICHCADPGRLRELLFPGSRLILERAAGGGSGDPQETKSGRKTSWTVAAVRSHDEVVPLVSVRANKAAAELVLPRLFPEAENLRAEVRAGRSRFDFCFEAPAGKKHLLEVKACSLVEYGSALFPDARSERALKHLAELRELSGQGYRTHILFLITHGAPEVFRPNLHAHSAFAELLSEPSNSVEIHAAATSTDESGETVLVDPEVRIDLSHGSLAAADSGSYLVVIELKKARHLAIGSLGGTDYPAGYYVYSGSAAKNLRSRTARHLRKTRKKFHWHIDYLLAAADGAYSLPIASYRNLECALAEALGGIGGVRIPRFGSSDCGCPSHLAYFDRNPLWDENFIDLLLRFRHVEAFVRP